MEGGQCTDGVPHYCALAVFACFASKIATELSFTREIL